MEENISNIQKIISSNGSNKEAWENLICDINSDEIDIINEIILNLEQFLKDRSNNEIALDIIDFIVIYGPIKIVELIAKKDFLKKILELLKNSSKSSVNVQKKIIFLTQKWAKKYENEMNSNLSGFVENYNYLQKGGIKFPPPTYKLETFTKYISDEEAQTAQIKANAIKKIKEDNEQSIKESINNVNNFANPFSSGSGELNDIVDKKVFNNESTSSNKKIENNEEDEEYNPYKENNNNNFNNNDNINNDNQINNMNNNNFNNTDNNKDNNLFDNNDDNNIYPLGHPKNKNKNIFNDGSNQQDSQYPNFPGQYNNEVMNQNKNNMNNNNNNNWNNNNNNMNTPNDRRNNIGNNDNNNNWNNNNANNYMNTPNNQNNQNNIRNNNNMFNNNQQNNNNGGRNRSYTAGNTGNFNNNNYMNNQFFNFNNNNYNNRNNNQNNNYNNNNNNNNYNNNNYNNNNYNNNNYNNNNYNNNNYNNNNYNRNNTNNFNNNYNRTNTNYNNNRFNNNNFNNNYQNSDTYDVNYFKQTIGNRLLQLNSWIDDGRYSFNSGKLKEGIIGIINELPRCEYLMNRCQLNGDKRGYEVARNMRMDMEQTCARYEDLMNNRNVEPFRSSFFGNTRQYYFNKDYMFGKQNDNIPIGNFNDYYKRGSGSGSGSESGSYSNSNYNNQDYQEKEVTIEDKLSSIGNTVKEGLFFFGGKIKDTAVSGYNYVRDKMNDNDKKKDSNDDYL